MFANFGKSVTNFINQNILEDEEPPLFAKAAAASPRNDGNRTQSELNRNQQNSYQKVTSPPEKYTSQQRIPQTYPNDRPIISPGRPPSHPPITAPDQQQQELSPPSSKWSIQELLLIDHLKLGKREMEKMTKDELIQIAAVHAEMKREEMGTRASKGPCIESVLLAQIVNIPGLTQDDLMHLAPKEIAKIAAVTNQSNMPSETKPSEAKPTKSVIKTNITPPNTSGKIISPTSISKGMERVNDHAQNKNPKSPSIPNYGNLPIKKTPDLKITQANNEAKNKLDRSNKSDIPGIPKDAIEFLSKDEKEHLANVVDKSSHVRKGSYQKESSTTSQSQSRESSIPKQKDPSNNQYKLQSTEKINGSSKSLKLPPEKRKQLEQCGLPPDAIDGLSLEEVDRILDVMLESQNPNATGSQPASRQHSREPSPTRVAPKMVEEKIEKDLIKVSKEVEKYSSEYNDNFNIEIKSEPILLKTNFENAAIHNGLNEDSGKLKASNVRPMTDSHHQTMMSNSEIKTKYGSPMDDFDSDNSEELKHEYNTKSAELFDGSRTAFIAKNGRPFTVSNTEIYFSDESSESEGIEMEVINEQYFGEDILPATESPLKNDPLIYPTVGKVESKENNIKMPEDSRHLVNRNSKETSHTNQILKPQIHENVEKNTSVSPVQTTTQTQQVLNQPTSPSVHKSIPISTPKQTITEKTKEAENHAAKFNSEIEELKRKALTIPGFNEKDLEGLSIDEIKQILSVMLRAGDAGLSNHPQSLPTSPRHDVPQNTDSVQSKHASSPSQVQTDKIITDPINVVKTSKANTSLSVVTNNVEPQIQSEDDHHVPRLTKQISAEKKFARIESNAVPNVIHPTIPENRSVSAKIEKVNSLDRGMEIKHSMVPTSTASKFESPVDLFSNMNLTNTNKTFKRAASEDDKKTLQTADAFAKQYIDNEFKLPPISKEPPESKRSDVPTEPKYSGDLCIQCKKTELKQNSQQCNGHYCVKCEYFICLQCCKLTTNQNTKRKEWICLYCLRGTPRKTAVESEVTNQPSKNQSAVNVSSFFLDGDFLNYQKTQKDLKKQSSTSNEDQQTKDSNIEQNSIASKELKDIGKPKEEPLPSESTIDSLSIMKKLDSSWSESPTQVSSSATSKPSTDHITWSSSSSWKPKSEDDGVKLTGSFLGSAKSNSQIVSIEEKLFPQDDFSVLSPQEPPRTAPVKIMPPLPKPKTTNAYSSGKSDTTNTRTTPSTSVSNSNNIFYSETEYYDNSQSTKSTTDNESAYYDYTYDETQYYDGYQECYDESLQGYYDENGMWVYLNEEDCDGVYNIPPDLTLPESNIEMPPQTVSCDSKSKLFESDKFEIPSGVIEERPLETPSEQFTSQAYSSNEYYSTQQQQQPNKTHNEDVFRQTDEYSQELLEMMSYQDPYSSSSEDSDVELIEEGSMNRYQTFSNLSTAKEKKQNKKGEKPKSENQEMDQDSSNFVQYQQQQEISAALAKVGRHPRTPLSTLIESSEEEEELELKKRITSVPKQRLSRNEMLQKLDKFQANIDTKASPTSKPYGQVSNKEIKKREPIPVVTPKVPTSNKLHTFNSVQSSRDNIQHPPSQYQPTPRPSLNQVRRYHHQPTTTTGQTSLYYRLAKDSITNLFNIKKKDNTTVSESLAKRLDIGQTPVSTGDAKHQTMSQAVSNTSDGSSSFYDSYQTSKYATTTSSTRITTSITSSSPLTVEPSQSTPVKPKRNDIDKASSPSATFNPSTRGKEKRVKFFEKRTWSLPETEEDELGSRSLAIDVDRVLSKTSSIDEECQASSPSTANTGQTKKKRILPKPKPEDVELEMRHPKLTANRARPLRSDEVELLKKRLLEPSRSKRIQSNVKSTSTSETGSLPSSPLHSILKKDSSRDSRSFEALQSRYQSMSSQTLNEFGTQTSFELEETDGKHPRSRISSLDSPASSPREFSAFGARSLSPSSPTGDEHETFREKASNLRKKYTFMTEEKEDFIKPTRNDQAEKEMIKQLRTKIKFLEQQKRLDREAAEGVTPFPGLLNPSRMLLDSRLSPNTANVYGGLSPLSRSSPLVYLEEPNPFVYNQKKNVHAELKLLVDDLKRRQLTEARRALTNLTSKKSTDMESYTYPKGKGLIWVAAKASKPIFQAEKMNSHQGIQAASPLRDIYGNPADNMLVPVSFPSLQSRLYGATDMLLANSTSSILNPINESSFLSGQRAGHDPLSMDAQVFDVNSNYAGDFLSTSRGLSHGISVTSPTLSLTRMQNPLINPSASYSPMFNQTAMSPYQSLKSPIRQSILQPKIEELQKLRAEFQGRRSDSKLELIESLQHQLDDLYRAELYRNAIDESSQNLTVMTTSPLNDIKRSIDERWQQLDNSSALLKTLSSQQVPGQQTFINNANVYSISGNTQPLNFEPYYTLPNAYDSYPVRDSVNVQNNALIEEVPITSSPGMYPQGDYTSYQTPMQFGQISNAFQPQFQQPPNVYTNNMPIVQQPFNQATHQWNDTMNRTEYKQAYNAQPPYAMHEEQNKQIMPYREPAGFSTQTLPPSYKFGTVSNTGLIKPLATTRPNQFSTMERPTPQKASTDWYFKTFFSNKGSQSSHNVDKSSIHKEKIRQRATRDKNAISLLDLSRHDSAYAPDRLERSVIIPSRVSIEDLTDERKRDYQTFLSPFYQARQQDAGKMNANQEVPTRDRAKINLCNLSTKTFRLSQDPKDRSIRTNGLGLSIVGGKILPETRGAMVAVIQKIFPGGVAELLNPEIQEGDVVLEWNGISLVDKSYEEVQKTIQTKSSGEIEILVCQQTQLRGVFQQPKIERVQTFAPQPPVTSEMVYMRSEPQQNITPHPSILSRPQHPPSILTKSSEIYHQQRSQHELDAFQSYEQQTQHDERYLGYHNTMPANPRDSQYFDRMRRREVTADEEIRGDLQIALTYSDVNQELVVHLIQARSLSLPPRKRLADPFVKVYLLPERCPENKRRIRYAHQTLDPFWNQSVEYCYLPRNFLARKFLEFTIWDYCKGSDKATAKPGTNTFLGEVIIDLAEHSVLDGRARWYPLTEHTDCPEAYLEKVRQLHEYLTERMSPSASKTWHPGIDERSDHHIHASNWGSNPEFPSHRDVERSHGKQRARSLERTLDDNNPNWYRDHSSDMHEEIVIMDEDEHQSLQKMAQGLSQNAMGVRHFDVYRGRQY